MDEEISGFLKKLKSSGIGKLLGNTNQRFFQANIISGLFGYRSDLRVKQFKKSYPMNSITGIIDNITPEELSLCDWKFGFKMKINDVIITFYAENLTEKLKWVNFFRDFLGKKASSGISKLFNIQTKQNKVNNETFEDKKRSVYRNNFRNLKVNDDIFQKKQKIPKDCSNGQINNTTNINTEEIINKDNEKMRSFTVVIRNHMQLNSDDINDFSNKVPEENQKFNDDSNLKALKENENQPNEIIEPEQATTKLNFKKEPCELEDCDERKKSKTEIKNLERTTKADHSGLISGKSQEKDFSLKPNMNKIEDNENIEFLLVNKKNESVRKVVTRDLEFLKESEDRTELNCEITENKKPIVSKEKVISEKKNFEEVIYNSNNINGYDNKNNNSNIIISKLNDNACDEGTRINLISVSDNEVGLKDILHQKKIDNINENQKNEPQTMKAKENKLENIRKKVLEKNKDEQILINKGNLKKMNIFDNDNNNNNNIIEPINTEKINFGKQKSQAKNIDNFYGKKLDSNGQNNSNILSQSVITNSKIYKKKDFDKTETENDLNTNKIRNQYSKITDKVNQSPINDTNMNDSTKNESSYINEFCNKNCNHSIVVENINKDAKYFVNKIKPSIDGDTTLKMGFMDEIYKNEKKNKLGKLVYDLNNEEFELKINTKIVEDFSEIKKRLLMEKYKFLEKDPTKTFNNKADSVVNKNSNPKYKVNSRKKNFMDEFKSDWE